MRRREHVANDENGWTHRTLFRNHAERQGLLSLLEQFVHSLECLLAPKRVVGTAYGVWG